VHCRHRQQCQHRQHHLHQHRSTTGTVSTFSSTP
jgi:hypothetical protein